MKQLHSATKRHEKFFVLFYYTIFMDQIEKLNEKYSKSFNNIAEAVSSLFNYKWFLEEFSYLINLRLSQLTKTTKWIQIDNESEIELYGCYSADEAHLLLENKLGRWQVFGTQYNYDRKISMVFVTLNKSDKDYSPSTLYEDYAISANQFHWQSMNKVRINSEEGQRIIQQNSNEWKFILFVRDSKTDEFGNTNGYYCLGLIDYNSSYGECPINVVWDMQNPIPGFMLEEAKAI